MDESPLTQQVRPTTFQPKITELYEDLFKVRNLCTSANVSVERQSLDEQSNDTVVESDGFWREFFLLKPDKSSFQRKLGELNPDDLLDLQVDMTSNPGVVFVH